MPSSRSTAGASWIPGVALLVACAFVLAVAGLAPAQDDAPDNAAAADNDNAAADDNAATADNNAAPDEVDEVPDEVTLRYGFAVGSTRTVTLIDRNVDTTTINGRELLQERTTKTTYEESVTAVDAEGTATIAFTYLRVVHDQQSTLYPQTLSFDSDNDDDRQRARYDVALKPFDALVGATLTVTVRPTGEVTSATGGADLLDRIFAGLEGPVYEELRLALSAQYSDEVLRAQFEALYRILPDEAVSVGDTWTRTRSLPVLFVGTVTVEQTFTLLSIGTDGDTPVVVIGVEATLSSDEDGGELSGPDVLPGIDITGAFRSGSQSGTITFDRTEGAGAFLKQSVKETLKLTLTGKTEAQDLESSATITGTLLMGIGTAETVENAFADNN